MKKENLFDLAKALYAEQKETKRLDGWLFVKAPSGNVGFVYSEYLS